MPGLNQTQDKICIKYFSILRACSHIDLHYSKLITFMCVGYHSSISENTHLPTRLLYTFFWNKQQNLKYTVSLRTDIQCQLNTYGWRRFVSFLILTTQYQTSIVDLVCCEILGAKKKRIPGWCSENTNSGLLNFPHLWLKCQTSTSQGQGQLGLF